MLITLAEAFKTKATMDNESSSCYILYKGHSIPNQQKKILTISDFFENWHTCWVHRETTPDQNLACFDYSPLMRYDQSIFEAIIYTLSFKQP